MTLTIHAERWCECEVASGSAGSPLPRCTDVAISLCQCCGLALCEAHEIICIRCSSPVCLNCDHVCRMDPEKAELHAA